VLFDDFFVEAGSLADLFRGDYAGGVEFAIGDEAGDDGTGDGGGAGHAGGEGGLVEVFEEIPGEAGGFLVFGAFDDNAHDGEVFFVFGEGPLGEEEGGGEVEGFDHCPPHFYRLFREEAGFAEDAHEFDVAGVAEGFFLHVGDGGGVEEGAKAVGVEGLEIADFCKFHYFRFGEGFAGDDLAVFYEASGSGVFFDDICGGEAGFVVEGPGGFSGKAADIDFDVGAGVELSGAVAGEEVAHAGGDAAVYDGGDALLFGERIEFEGIFWHEADVTEVFARFDDGAKGLKAEGAGEGAEDDVVRFDEGFELGDVGEIGAGGGDATRAASGGGFEGGGTVIGEGDLE